MEPTLTSPPRQSPPAPVLTDAQRFEILAAASAAAPICGNDSQAFGGKTLWNQNIRPGRCEARRKFLLTMLRAAEIAMEDRPELETRHIVTAIRSHALNAGDLLIDPRTGKWLSTPKAVKHRGLELAGSIAELAMIVYQVENEACKAKEKGAA